MSKEQKEISRMREQLARISKVHEAKKKVLLAAQRKNAVRTLQEKFQKVKARNKTLEDCNKRLQRNNQSLNKELASLKTTNDELRDFITTSAVDHFDFDDDELIEAWPEPKSPGSQSSQRTSVHVTPKKKRINTKQIPTKVHHVDKILDLRNDDFMETQNNIQSQSSAQHHKKKITTQ